MRVRISSTTIALWSTGTFVSSSLRMVPLALVAFVSRVAQSGLDRVTVKVFSASSVLLSTVGTVNSVLASPAVTVTVPVVSERAVRAALSPVSMVAVQVTSTSRPLTCESVSVKVTPSPSAPSPSAMPMEGGSSLSVMVPSTLRTEPSVLMFKTPRISTP